jgi:hypothetical protein
VGYQLRCRVDRTPRLFNSAVISPKLVSSVERISMMIGSACNARGDRPQPWPCARMVSD